MENKSLCDPPFLSIRPHICFRHSFVRAGPCGDEKLIETRSSLEPARAISMSTSILQLLVAHSKSILGGVNHGARVLVLVAGDGITGGLGPGLLGLGLGSRGSRVGLADDGVLGLLDERLLRVGLEGGTSLVTERLSL